MHNMIYYGAINIYLDAIERSKLVVGDKPSSHVDYGLFGPRAPSVISDDIKSELMPIKISAKIV
jgi:hypothetical protein